MYVDIIPSEHSIGIHPLTYSIPENLGGDISPGCLVEIPVRQGSEYGIVVGYRATAPENMEIRDIIRWVRDVAVLAPYQIALILEIATKYLIPIHRVLGFFLSKNTLKRLEKKNFEQIEPITSLMKNHEYKGVITLMKNSIITEDIIKTYIKPGMVVICPDDFTLYRVEQCLGGLDSILFLPAESTETKKAQSWIDIKNKKYDIIVGNRKLLYYNLSQYNTIVYLEDAFGREYFHYPIRIDYIDILDMLSHLHSHNIHIISSTARLSTLTRFRHFDYQSV